MGKYIHVDLFIRIYFSTIITVTTKTLFLHLPSHKYRTSGMATPLHASRAPMQSSAATSPALPASSAGCWCRGDAGRCADYLATATRPTRPAGEERGAAVTTIAVIEDLAPAYLPALEVELDSGNADPRCLCRRRDPLPLPLPWVEIWDPLLRAGGRLDLGAQTGLLRLATWPGPGSGLGTPTDGAASSSCCPSRGRRTSTTTAS